MELTTSFGELLQELPASLDSSAGSTPSGALHLPCNEFSNSRANEATSRSGMSSNVVPCPVVAETVSTEGVTCVFKGSNPSALAMVLGASSATKFAGDVGTDGVSIGTS